VSLGALTTARANLG